MAKNLIAATAAQWMDLLHEATRMGVRDEMEGRGERQGDAIVAVLGVEQYRTGHARYLRHAYMAGRFHVRCMGKE